jgi:hypothetical protein
LHHSQIFFSAGFRQTAEVVAALCAPSTLSQDVILPDESPARVCRKDETVDLSKTKTTYHHESKYHIHPATYWMRLARSRYGLRYYWAQIMGSEGIS